MRHLRWWLDVVAGEDRNRFRNTQYVRNGDVGYHGDCALFSRIPMTCGRVNLVRCCV